MGGERIGPAETGRGDGGDDVAQGQTRSPDAIQREIEQTRSELAETIDAIADRISPRRAASRSAAAVRAGMSGMFGGNGNGNNGPPAAVLDAAPAAAAHTDTARRQQEIESVARSGGGAAYAGESQYIVKRTLRTDRVLIVVGTATTVAAIAVLWRSRRR